MACIGCGLGVNPDGRGRVDVDPSGGIQCQGASGGPANVVGSGIRIKLDPTAGNAAVVDSDGLWVPPSGRALGHAQSIETGTMAAGTTSNTAAIAISNATGTVPLLVMWGCAMDWEATTGLGAANIILYAQTGGGGWYGAAGFISTSGNWQSPIMSRTFYHTIPAGGSHTLETRAIVYEGTVVASSITVYATSFTSV